MNDYEILEAIVSEYETQIKSIISQGLLLLKLEGHDLNDEELERLAGYGGFIQPETWRELPNLNLVHYLEERLAYIRSLARDARNVNDADKRGIEDG